MDYGSGGGMDYGSGGGMDYGSGGGSSGFEDVYNKCIFNIFSEK